MAVLVCGAKPASVTQEVTQALESAMPRKWHKEKARGYGL
jgi:hypothetical protein